jgi:hypothetical protein
LPKLCYLVFNSGDYFVRFVDVSRHDASGNFLVWQHFVNSASEVWRLVFRRQIDFKIMLPEGAIIPPLQVPLLVLGLATALLSLRRSEHLFAVAVMAFTVLVNLGAFVADYRLINAMPIVFLLMGIGLVQVERVLGRGSPGRIAIVSVVGVLVLGSISDYLSHPDHPGIRINYGTAEMALVRRLGLPNASAETYALVPGLTYRSIVFTPQEPRVRAPSEGLDGDAERHYSTEAAGRVLANVETLLRESAVRQHAAHFVLSEESPYTGTVLRYLTARGKPELGSLEVTDPVTHRTVSYRTASVAHPAEVLATPADVDVALPALSGAPAEALRGSLVLETFADPEQAFLVDVRRVRADLDFDFASTMPYEGKWTPPFSLRWSGYLRIGVPGDYRLEATCDDGCRVFLDGQPVLSDWHVGAPRVVGASVPLGEGWHSLRVDYFQQANEARLALRIGMPPDALAAIPPADLAAAPLPARPDESRDNRP